MRARVLVLVVALSGCVDDRLVHCPSPRGELACVAGSVCVASGCASIAEADACAAKAEGEMCMVGTAEGRCTGGACRAPVCGNGVMEGDEQCDDGNLTSGDGCAGNCASTETCGNGVTDFVRGEQCDDGNVSDGDSCRSDCTVPRCGDGVVDVQNGEGCDLGSSNSNVPDAPCRANCQPARCGDAVLDSGEACDDGNVLTGDGCSSDCRSDESCGNGVIDGIHGEQCDDGDRFLSRDGCTSTCTVEPPGWRQLQPAPPTGRYYYGAAYDSARARVVMFGGLSNVATDETWELVGSTWVRIDVTRAPSPRQNPAMAYDPVRHRVVLFGGFGSVGGSGPMPLADTWEYDGITWTKITTSTVPGARVAASMVFDPSRGTIVMFGGGSPLTNEVWTYDGTSWMLVATTNAPSARTGSAIAYDTAGSRIVIYGGVDESFTRLGDSYQLVGTTWTALPTGQTGLDTSMAYDANRGRLVLVGAGPGAPTQTYTYELVGSAWSLITPTTNLTARGGISIQYVPGCTCVVAFGGISIAGIQSDAWTYNGTTWKQLATVQSPEATRSTAVVYDAHRGKVVLYGGVDPLIGTFDTTWELSHGYWMRGPASGPPARAYHALAYDAERERVVLFGGNGPGGDFADTWEYDGLAWTQRTPTTSPPSTIAHALAYDAKRHRVVMFGGNASNAVVGTTYEYDGTTWSLMSPTMSPPARAYHQIAYDSTRGRIVLFGGFDGSQILGDTWEYDGTTWIPISVTQAPSARHSYAMTFDAVRGTTLVFGGIGTSAILDDTWEYDGASWTRVNPSTTPEPRGFTTATYDPVAGATILYGGLQTAGNGTGDTWSLSWSSTAFPAEACRIATLDGDTDTELGCADPDCWGRCAPQCPPHTTCNTSLPRCGDGACAPVEDYLICPTDCAAP